MNAAARVAKRRKRWFNEQQERDRKGQRAQATNAKILRDREASKAKPKGKAGLTPVGPGKYVDARGQTWVDIPQR